MVVSRIERAPRVKLRIIFLSSPAREERERHEETQDQHNCDPTISSQNLRRIGANVATEAEQQCKLKSLPSVSQWYPSPSRVVCSILFRKLDLSITEKYQNGLLPLKLR